MPEADGEAGPQGAVQDGPRLSWSPSHIKGPRKWAFMFGQETSVSRASLRSAQPKAAKPTFLVSPPSRLRDSLE